MARKSPRSKKTSRKRAEKAEKGKQRASEEARKVEERKAQVARRELARKETPEWDWTVLDPDLGSWVDMPYDVLLDADVVVTHAGPSALAEVAASRTPAVVVPRPGPHRGQEVTAEALWRGGWPAVVIDAWPRQGWAERLEHADRLDGDNWASWCDGHAAERIATVVRSVALEARPRLGNDAVTSAAP